jgi:LysM repeat protein
MRTYIIQSRDTVGKIARLFYDDVKLAKKLADYNGLRNPDQIVVGQSLKIPSRQELDGVVEEPAARFLGLQPPQGLQGILDTFGNIYNYLREDGTLDPRWEVEQLARAPLPFSIPLSWDRSKLVTNLYGHTKWKGFIPEVFATIEREGLREEIKTFGGCFNFRAKRTSGKLSAHSWGIAIDLNPETNQQATSGDMDAGVVEIFRRFGFKWGGDWSGKDKDPMHFQFCTGY